MDSRMYDTACLATDLSHAFLGDRCVHCGELKDRFEAALASSRA